jgi:hypothetical protein
LQRAIRAGVIAPKRARSKEEQSAISGALSLLTNVVMAFNTQRLQSIVNRRAKDGIGGDETFDEMLRIGPVATRHINFRGQLHFPMDEYEAQLLAKVA